MVTQIVPHTKGIDICSHSKKHFAIIRSDLGYFMVTTDIHEEVDAPVYRLHDNCSGGDAYLADDHGYYYIIKGTKYHSCKNLNTDADGEDHDLVDNMQGGDHYYNWGWENTIVYGKSQKIMFTLVMDSQPAANPGYLSPMLAGGSYYWANDYVYAMNHVWEQGVVTFNEGCNPVEDWNKGDHITVAKNVVNFLPGGIAQSHGKAFGKWVAICSNTDTGRWVIYKIGFDVQAAQTIVLYMDCNTIPKIELLKHMCQYQFSLDASYGGISTDTTNLDWDNTSGGDITQPTVSGGVLWQYQLGFGQTSYLYDTQLEITSGDPPDILPDNITVGIGAKL